MKKILIGGSPCTFWSISQATGTRETKAEGLGWELFLNYLIAKEKFKPDFFLYENNKSAATAIKEQISKELGVELMYINSALVSAQNRNRFYAFNWEAQQPEDRGILFQDILENGMAFQEKSFTLTTRCGNGAVIYDTLGRHRHSMVAVPIAQEEGGENNKSIYEVKNGIVEIKGKEYKIDLPNGFYIFRQMTPTECERLQTMPDGYTKAVCKSQKYKMLGNGWTAEVIIWLLKEGLKDVPRDEELIVLSMYDGIATGRYCLERLGFKNIRYYAYEIDKPAISVALDNYPDIIEMGDAFQVRNDDWKLF